MLTLYQPSLQIPHQAASPIEETLQGISITDSDDSTHETDSVADSEECSSDEDSPSSDSQLYFSDDGERVGHYIREVYAAVQEALRTNTHQNIVAKIQNLRDSHRWQDGLTGSHMIYGMMQTVLKTHFASEEEFNEYIEKLLVDWNHPLKHFIYGRLGELMLIDQLEKSCSEIETPFSPFSKILTCLYDNHLVRGHTILYWACKDRDDFGSYMTLLNQSHEIIKMLKESINDFDPKRFFAYGELETESEESEPEESESEEDLTM